MAAAIQLAREQHRINLTTLEGLDGRRSALQSALVAARSALDSERAQADIDVLEPELATVEKIRDVLIPEIARQKRVFTRALLDTFPPELLRAIFLEVVSQPDTLHRRYDAARNALPFYLSAVCRLWRSIALNVAALWADVAVPQLLGAGRSRTTHRGHLDRVEALLERSKQHSLNVCLDWGHQEGDTVPSWQDCSYYQLIFDVGLHINRWRRVCMILPEGVARRHLGWLCEPTPLLEGCTIVPRSPSESPLPWSDLRRYLPYCPRLKDFCSTKIFVAPEHPLPLLSTLHLRVEQDSFAALFSLLRNTPSLQMLFLEMPDGRIDAPRPPTLALELRAVTQLGLYGDISSLPPILASISMPALACLYICSDAADVIHLFRDTVVHRVSKLMLGQSGGPTLDGQTALHLGALEHVRELELTDLESILPQFFRELVAGRGLWPELETVTIDGGSLDDDAADAFLRFIQSRRNAREAASLSPFRVSLEGVTTPAWLTAHVRASFGDAAVEWEMSASSQSGLGCPTLSVSSPISNVSSPTPSVSE